MPTNHDERYLVIKAKQGRHCACQYKAEALAEKKRMGGEENGMWVWDRQGKNPCKGQVGCEVK